MTREPEPRPGGRILVDALEAQGVDHLFCVPGESFLAVLDALHDSPIAVTVCRQEGGAAMMADAYGKLTGRPGICFVTRGPGATNASAGVHIAAHDSSPMVLFIGQVGRDMRHREAFQEIDYRQMFGGIAKWVAEIDDPARVPEFVHRAFATAMAGRPGPVVLSLPEDMLVETAVAPDAPYVEQVPIAPPAASLAALERMLADARQPIVIVGGPRWTGRGIDDMRRFVERFDLPVGSSFRRQMLFDQTHQNYAGDVGLGPNPELCERVRRADLLLLVGGRLSESPSQGYTLIDVPVPRQTLVHVHPGAEELGKVYAPALAINADPASFAAAAAALEPPAAITWREHTRAANAAYHDWSDGAPAIPGAVQYGEIMCWLRNRLPPDAVICNGAGNFAAWIHRFYRFRRFGTQLAPTSGSMGYGVPAAVAAQRLHPDRMVVAFAGDGDFLMNGQELATAVQYDLPVIVIVVNNAMYGTIRMHQEAHYPGRVSATSLRNPDFVALARAYGAHAEKVERTEDFAPAFEKAPRPAGPRSSKSCSIPTRSCRPPP
jgi:acetolactate synthase I/II/III large subunit